MLICERNKQLKYISKKAENFIGNCLVWRNLLQHRNNKSYDRPLPDKRLYFPHLPSNYTTSTHPFKKTISYEKTLLYTSNPTENKCVTFLRAFGDFMGLFTSKKVPSSFPSFHSYYELRLLINLFRNIPFWENGNDKRFKYYYALSFSKELILNGLKVICFNIRGRWRRKLFVKSEQMEIFLLEWVFGEKPWI